MKIASDYASVRLPAALWRVLFLLVLSVSINYIDRGNLSIAAPLLHDEFGLTPGRLGILLSSFFWSYAVFQVFSGWLVDRFNVSLVMASGFFLWSAATAATGLIHTFTMLIALRLILGLGESVAYPCYSKILAAYFAEHQRGLANSLIDAGSKVGPAFGTITGGVLMAYFGWRSFFTVLGLVSLLWLPLWFAWMPRSAELTAANPETVPAIFDILRRRIAWATFGGHFCGNYFWYFLLTWLPFYLVRERHFTMVQMASLGSTAYLITAGSTVIAGWFSDRAIASGAGAGRVRKRCAGFGLAFASIIAGAGFSSGRTASIVLLFLACAGYGVFSSSHWAITQTVAGPVAAGKWSGLQNFFANLAGVAAPALTGFVVDRTGHFVLAFAAAAAVALTGAGIYLAVMGKIEPVVWRDADEASPNLVSAY